MCTPPPPWECFLRSKTISPVLLEMDSYTRYTSWLPEKMQQYNQLMTKFTLLKEKECAITGHASGRKQKKENLLRMKENKTITREGIAELEYINKEEDAKELYQTNITVIEKRKEKELDEAKAAYQKAIAKAEEALQEAKQSAESKYEKTKGTYESQTQQSLSKIKREYDAKKQMFGLQKQSIEDERTHATKSSAEIALEQDKRKILQEMQSLIILMEMSKTQVSAEYRDNLPPVPALPEAIETHYVAPVAVAIVPVGPVATVYDPNTPLPLNITSSSDLAAWEAKAASGREEIRERRAEQKRKEREREVAESNRKPTVYGFICDLENRAPVKATYVANPVTDDDTGAKSDFFLRDGD